MSDVSGWRPSQPGWWESKSADEIETLEHGGRTYYRDAIKRKRVKSGEDLEAPVLIRVPRSRELVKARAEALAQVAEDTGRRDARGRPELLTIEQAVGIVGEDYWNRIDTIHLLSHCVFQTRRDELLGTETDPERHCLPEILDETYQTASLFALAERLDFWSRTEDPRIESLTESELLQLVEAVSRRRSTSPLLGIGPSGLHTFIVFTAGRLWSSLTPSSSSPSQTKSTPSG